MSAAQGPLHLVEVELELANPSPRLAEADLALRLPDGARITRLALAVGGVLREAAVLPRADAVSIYQDITRQLRDPALLERHADDALRLRVAPIPAQGRTQVVFSYVDLERSPGRSIAAHSDERWIARIALPVPKPARAPKRLRVLIDTSASLRPRFDEHLQRSRELLSALAREFSTPVALELVAFDQTVEVVHDGSLGDVPEHAWNTLRDRGALGATRLADALKAPTRADRVLVITDGQLTEPDAALLAGGKALARAGVDRLDVVAFADNVTPPPSLQSILAGEVRLPLAFKNDGTPPRSLQSIRDRVHPALPQRGLVAWHKGPLDRLARRLTRETRELPLDVPGAAWWWPREVELGADDELLLLVRSQVTPAPILRDRSAVPLALAAEEASGPLFERMWQAHVVDAELAGTAVDPAAMKELARRTAELGVLTPLTAFLALESEAQERQYHVRRADAPIVTIDGGEVVVRPPTGAPLRGARLASQPEGASPGPAERAEFNRITVELEKKAREMQRLYGVENAREWLRVARLLVEAGQLAGPDELRAELDSLLDQLAKDLTRDPDRDEMLAFLRPFAQRVVDSRGDACHFKALENALRTYSARTRPHAAGAYPPLTGSAGASLMRTPGEVVRLADERVRKGRPHEATRLLGSLADIDGPLAAAVALDTLPEGRALATALLREPDADDRSSHSLLSQRRLLAESRARAGAFAEAFALLAAPLPAAPLRADWSSDQTLYWFALQDAAADLRLLGARWAAEQPQRKAALARDLERLTGRRSPDALVIDAYYYGFDAHSPMLHAFDGWGALAHASVLYGEDRLRSAQLRLSAAELPSALEIGDGKYGDYVRLDMFDATGPKVNMTSRLIVLAGARTKIDLPAHLIGHAVCPTPAPP